MNRICKTFGFEAAHQLEHAYTKECHECVHGHSYEVELYLISDRLDNDRMVLDFGCLKGFKDEVMARWDHGVLFHENKRRYIEPLIGVIWKKEKVTFLDVNPTAESMARILYRSLYDYLRERGMLSQTTRDSKQANFGIITVEKVRVRETSTGWAEYEPLALALAPEHSRT